MYGDRDALELSVEVGPATVTIQLVGAMDEGAGADAVGVLRGLLEEGYRGFVIDATSLTCGPCACEALDRGRRAATAAGATLRVRRRTDMEPRGNAEADRADEADGDEGAEGSAQPSASTTDAPEADVLEQRQVVEEDQFVAAGPRDPEDADEADWLEQSLGVAGDEERR